MTGLLEGVRSKKYGELVGGRVRSAKMAVLDYGLAERRGVRFGAVFPYLTLPMMWAGAVLLGWLGMLPGLVGLGMLVWRRRWLVAVVTVGLSPFVVFFVEGMADYSAGTGRLRIHGMTRGLVRMDRETRLENRSVGCVELDGSWIRDVSYNGALRTMVRVFGPMRGTYTGPYPDEAGAYGAVAARGVAVDLREVAADGVVIGGVRYALAPGTGMRLLQGFHEGPATDVFEEGLVRAYGPAEAVVVGGRLVVLAVPTRTLNMPGGGRDSWVVVLIDTVRGRAFADYQGRTGPAFRRWVNWR